LTDKPIYMANQIGQFWVSQGPDKAPDAIVKHIRKFWDPRSVTRLLCSIDADGEGPDPSTRSEREA
jgi:formate dehydrogenase subunit delta